jgi:TonB family protein
MKRTLALIVVVASQLAAQVSVNEASKVGSNVSPVYVSLCGKLPVGNLQCGQKIAVSERHGTWLKITLPDGAPRYALASAISKTDSTFVSFDDTSGIADLGPVNCNDPKKPVFSGPVLAFDPEPEYSDLARKKKISGSVYLSLTVGTDGLPHDIKVERKLGYGLDEKAVEAVRRWKFKPAVKDGQPVAAKLTVSVSFRLM